MKSSRVVHRATAATATEATAMGVIVTMVAVTETIPMVAHTELLMVHMAPLAMVDTGLTRLVLQTVQPLLA